MVVLDEASSAPSGQALERHRVGAAGRRAGRRWGRDLGRRVGTVPVASLTITKLAWLREHEPETFARRPRAAAARLADVQLTGELVTDRGDASGTGYWSPTSTPTS